MVWNSLPDNLWNPDAIIDNFKRLLKTVLFSAYQCIGYDDALYKFTIYLLTCCAVRFQLDFGLFMR